MNHSARLLKASILVIAALSSLMFTACSRSEAINIVRVEDRIPAAARGTFAMALRHYAFESQMATRMATAEKLHQDSTWTIADREWPAFANMVSTNDVPALKDCRTIEAGMIAVPRVLNGDAFFELVPVESGSAPYTTKPLGRAGTQRR